LFSQVVTPMWGSVSHCYIKEQGLKNIIGYANRVFK
jgi:hypothetical protein